MRRGIIVSIPNLENIYLNYCVSYSPFDQYNEFVVNIFVMWVYFGRIMAQSPTCE